MWLDVKESEFMLNDEIKNKVLTDYQETIKFVNRNSKSLMHPTFSHHSSMYTFTTEILSGYINKLGLRDKNVLTVTASGDQILNLVFNDVKNIDGFDVNTNAYYITQLKIAALKSLPYEEFINYFSACKSFEDAVFVEKKVENNSDVFAYNVYQKFSDKLPEDAKYYWDLLYKEFNYDGLNLHDSVCIPSDKDTAIFANDYLKNATNYEILKQKINNVNINYYVKDILQLHTLSKKYDGILLSNIYDYVVSDWYGVISAEDFNSYVQNKLSNLLNENGTIQLAYKYHYKTKNVVYGSTLKKLFASKYKIDVNESLNKLSYKKILVPSLIEEYRKNKEMDCVYLYNNSKKR